MSINQDSPLLITTSSHQSDWRHNYITMTHLDTPFCALGRSGYKMQVVHLLFRSYMMFASCVSGRRVR